jgi:hypothetical protein
MGGGSGSSSSSSNTTSTTTQDQKVSATDNAVALGPYATLEYVDQFSPEVRAAFADLVGLVRDAGIVATSFASKAVESNEAAMDRLADQAKASVDAASLQKETILKSLIPYAGIALIISVFAFSKKGKKK